MDKSEPNPGRLTDFERAICYYTLPATDSRVTTGLVLTFALILFEALAALTYGLLQPDHFHNVYTVVGTWSLGVMIVFGLVVFTGRALANEVRRRRTLALAQRMPEPGDMDDSIPDPFARHKLLRITQGSATPIACTDNEGLLHYTIETEPSSGWTNIKNSEGVEHLRINVRKTNTSFSLTEDETPSQTDVYAGAELVGTIQRHFSFKVPLFTVVSLWPVQRKYTVRDNSIYRDHRLVGRIYRLRRVVYLDIHEEQYCEAILAFFVIHSC